MGGKKEKKNINKKGRRNIMYLGQDMRESLALGQRALFRFARQLAIFTLSHSSSQNDLNVVCDIITRHQPDGPRALHCAVNRSPQSQFARRTFKCVCISIQFLSLIICNLVFSLFHPLIQAS